MAAGICRLTEDGMIITQNCTADETVLTAYDWNGQRQTAIPSRMRISRMMLRCASIVRRR